MKNDLKKDQQVEDVLFEKISEVINRTRQIVVSAVNTSEVYAKYEIGRYIVEEEQNGEKRAQYGLSILKNLSIKLTDKFGNGWSLETLKKCRFFYSVYSKIQIGSTVSTKLIGEGKDQQCGPNLENEIKSSLTDFRIHSFTLSWSHYLILMRIENVDERNFYEVECTRQMWSVRQLNRQIGSSLYERLALSRNKEEIMRLAQEGQIIEKPTDIIKNPITLEFLGLKPDIIYTENKLENAIISKMQQFLLELGKGFLFEARQKRFTFDEQHFYVDLVFYNRLLQCYVLIDLKTNKISHQDLGQMQMYVNYYDRYMKQDYEKPTIGILLCKEKNDALVQLTLPQNSNIYATEYSLYLPNKELLQNKLKQWINEFEEK